MDFALSDEQRQIVDTTRAFVEKELFPHEAEVERTGALRRSGDAPRKSASRSSESRQPRILAS